MQTEIQTARVLRDGHQKHCASPSLSLRQKLLYPSNFWQDWKSKLKLHKLSLLQNSCSRQFKFVTFVPASMCMKNRLSSDSSQQSLQKKKKKNILFLLTPCLFGWSNANFFKFLSQATFCDFSCKSLNYFWSLRFLQYSTPQSQTDDVSQLQHLCAKQRGILQKNPDHIWLLAEILKKIYRQELLSYCYYFEDNSYNIAGTHK